MSTILELEAEQTVALLAARGLTAATAESCTGGLIAKLLTDIPGSSAVFFGACVTYTNAVKTQLLGVRPETIARDTEVSHACAAEMAERVRLLLGTELGVSTTGFAGPGGGTEADPVGTVYLGISTKRGTQTERFCAPNGADRQAVREAAARRALALLRAAAEERALV